MINTAFTLSVCLFVQVLSAPVNHLDVFISRKELKRFFPALTISDFYVIRKGIVDQIVENQIIDDVLPAIVPSIQSLEFYLHSKHKLHYKLHLSSSDQHMMKTPTANIKMSSQVPKKPKPFKIRFPCTHRKSGEAVLTMKMEFMVPSKKKAVLSQFVIKLKRKCEKVREVQAATPVVKENYICAKKWGRERVMRRFCISDFAIRARIEKRSVDEDGRVRYKVRVTKSYKRGRVPISKKQYIEILGKESACNSKAFQIRKTYFILGKENRRTNTLFLDDYTFAIEWSHGGKKLAKLRKRKGECPNVPWRE